MPRVSICIPNRNYARYLGEAIASALAQTERDIEVLVIDDQSTDNSVEIARSFSDPRVRVIALNENIGLIANYNLCIAEATSPYVKLLCSDDLLHPTCVAELADALDANQGSSIAFSDREMLFNDGKLRKLDSPLTPGVPIDGTMVVKQSRLAFNVIGEPTTVMIRKDMLKSISFDHRYLQAPDWIYFLRALRNTTALRIPKVLSVFRWHEDNASWWLKRKGTSVHDFLLLSEELECESTANEFPACSIGSVRMLRLMCLMRSVDLFLRNLLNRDFDAARRCGSLAWRAAIDFIRPWKTHRIPPIDF